MNVKAQFLDEGLNRLGKWKVELVLVTAMILLAWLDSSQAGESLNFIIDQLIGLSPYLLVSIGLTAYAKATGADCVALDNSVDPAWASQHVQSDGCVQGNLANTHLVTGGDALVEETKRVVRAFSKGPHIFNLGHGLTPDADPENVQIMIDAVRSA